MSAILDLPEVRQRVLRWSVAEYEQLVEIVLGREQQIEVYRQPQDGVYQQRRAYGLEEVLQCEAVPEVEFAVGELFE